MSEQELKNLLSAIVESSDDAIIGKQLDGTIISWSKGAEKIYGYSAKEIIGKNISILVPQNKINELNEIYKKLKKGIKVENFETERINKDNLITEISVTISPIKNEEGKVIGASAIARDISERKKMERKLIELEKRFQVMADNAPVLIWMSDTNKLCTFFNKGWLEFTGRSLEQEYGNGWAEGVHPDDFDMCLDIYTSAFDKREEFSMEYRLRRYDGQYRWILDKGVPRYDNNGNFEGYIGSCIDITERKKIEDRNREALREKEVLLKEIHHRVKNNLQIVSSLLNLQSSYQVDERAGEVLKESQNRIQAMAIIHQKLYSTNNLVNINFQDYMKELTENLLSSYRLITSAVNLKLDIDEVSFGLDSAITLGLLINELISNSLKHAFPSKRNGNINIFLKNLVDNKFKLVISDDGVGFPDDFDIEKRNTLGLSLVLSLVEQLNGTLELNRKKKTEFNITFEDNNNTH
ncbi:MAG: PAS domain S-box protein [Ignavibacteriaceae bacterium]